MTSTLVIWIPCTSWKIADRADERLASRSDAVISVLRLIGGSWTIAAALLRIIPRSIRDWGYGIIARNRYRIFGKSESCPLPDEEIAIASLTCDSIEFREKELHMEMHHFSRLLREVEPEATIRPP